MDTNQTDDTKMQNSAVQQPIQNGGAPQVQDDLGSQPVIQAPVSVTPRGKEAAPIAVGAQQEYIRPAAHETQPVIPEAVQEAGVNESPQPETLQLQREHHAVGIQAAKESTPLPVQPQVVLPGSTWTQPQAEEAATGKADRASTWYGKLWMFVLDKRPYQKEAA